MVGIWAALLSPYVACLVGVQGACPPAEYCDAAFPEGSSVCPDEGTCRPMPSEADIELWLPVPAGERVFCTQGPLRTGTSTHATCSVDRRFALDFASSAFEAPRLVLAAADGVAYGWGDCPSTDLNHAPPDASCNVGLGNVVRVQHPRGLFTEYAHLSAVLITNKQQVKKGEPIGIEGNTGAAGSRHLHFSLHAGDASRLEPDPSLPIRHLVVGGASRRTVDSLSLACRRAEEGHPDPASALVSATPPLPKEPAIGFTTVQRYALEAAAGRIFEAETRPAALALLRKLPSEPLARYWLAVGLELDGRRAEALPLFRELSSGHEGPLWISRWSWLRLADLELSAGHIPEARADWENALRGSPSFDVEFRRFADWLRRALDRASGPAPAQGEVRPPPRRRLPGTSR